MGPCPGNLTSAELRASRTVISLVKAGRVVANVRQAAGTFPPMRLAIVASPLNEAMRHSRKSELRIRDCQKASDSRHFVHWSNVTRWCLQSLPPHCLFEGRSHDPQTCEERKGEAKAAGKLACTSRWTFGRPVSSMLPINLQAWRAKGQPGALAVKEEGATPIPTTRGERRRSRG